jgi:hypothetical protein
MAAAACSMPSAWAQERPRKIETALIASFTCSKCARLDPMLKSLEMNLGYKLHFVPIADRLDDYAVLAWYGLRTRVPRPEELRQTLYGLSQQLMLKDPTVDDVIQFLQLEGIGIPPEEMRTHITSSATLELMRRGVQLGVKAGVEFTPAVVFVQGQQILKMVENRDMTEATFMSAVLSAKKEMNV